MVADQCNERRAEAEGAGTHRRQILLSWDSRPKMGSRDEQPSSLSSFSKIRPSWDHFTGRRRSRRTTASVDSFHSLHKTGEASDLLRDAIMQDMGTQDGGAPLQMSRAVLKAISKLSRKRWKTLERFLEDYKLPPVIGRKVFHIIIRISNRELNLLDVDAGLVNDDEYKAFCERLHDLTPLELAELLAKFFDLDDDGSVSMKELCTILRQRGMNDKIGERIVTGALAGLDTPVSVVEFANLLSQNSFTVKYARDSLKKTFAIPSSGTTRNETVAAVPPSKSGCTFNSYGGCPFPNLREIPTHVLLTHGISLLIFAVRYLQFRYIFFAGQALSIAKGTGLAVLFLLCLVYVTKLRMLAWSLPRSMREFASHTSLHAHAGAGACAWSLLHIAAHFARPALIVLTGAEMRTTISGALALVCFVAMTLTGTSRFGTKAAYRLFLLIHHAHTPLVPLMIAHCWAAPYRPTILGFLFMLIAVNYAIEYVSSRQSRRHQKPCALNNTLRSTRSLSRPRTDTCTRGRPT